MMEDTMCICKICKKVFTDEQGLNMHRMAQHPQQKTPIQASMNTSSNCISIITNQFRNNGNLIITRVQKETINPVLVSQSAMNQNQNSFRKGTVSASINVRRAETKLLKQGDGTRVRPPFRSPDARIKGAASSIKSMVMSAQGIEVDDDTTDWQKWEPPMSKDHNVCSSTTPKTKSKSDANKITKTAAEIALSAFSPNQISSTTARKSVPPLLRMVPSAPGQGTNGGGGGANKRPVPGSKVSSTTQRVAAGGATTPCNAIAGIMQNMQKMRTINATSRTAVVAPNQKMISLPQQSKKGSTSAGVTATPSYQPPKKQPPKKQVQQEPIRVVSKPHPPVAKNKAKILPRNAFSNALPKPGVPIPGQAASSRRLTEDMEVDSSDQQDDDDDQLNDDDGTDSDQFIQQPPTQAKKSVPPATPVRQKPVAAVAAIASGGGKAPPQKSLNANRFNPIQSPKKGKGKAVPPPPVSTASSKTASPKGSPNGKSKAATSTTNGTKKDPPPSSSSGSVTTGKKSVPPAGAAGKKKKKGSEDKVKKLKSYVPTMPGTDYDMPKLSAIGSYTNRAGQQVWVCLVCNEKEHEDSSRDMICCEMCEDWYHWDCVGIRQTMEEEDPWYCKRCIYQASPNPKKDFPKIFKNDSLDL